MSQADPGFEDLSIPQLLKKTVKRCGTQKAVVFDGRTLDFQTFDALSDRVAGALWKQGVRKGERIALYCINSDAFALAYFGIVKAGATVVPINFLLNAREIAYILDDAGARGLIYHTAFKETVTSLEQSGALPGLRVCIGDREGRVDGPSWEELLTFEGEPPVVSVDPAEDVSAILYTSGTTGRPKGAMLTHRNLVANTWSVKQMLGLEVGNDVMLVVLPMFHAFAATVGMLTPLLRGCALVPLPRFDPRLVADTIAAEKVTVFPAVPSMYSVLLRLPGEYTSKFACLRACISGGAAMPIEVMKQFEARYGKGICEGDGPTECGPVTCVNPVGGKRKPGSVGPAVPGVKMRIMDDQGKELPRGERGEICVRGPNVMKGYWNRPAETREAFFGEWFRSGDIGTQDEEGYFYIVDRKRDLIIVNGMNIYPRMVEEVLYQIESVAEAAVVGEPNELHGEIPVAFIALKEGAVATSGDIRAYCREQLGRHEVPRKVFFLPELPKNATGKILKRELRRHGELERGIDSRRPGDD